MIGGQFKLGAPDGALDRTLLGLIFLLRDIVRLPAGSVGGAGEELALAGHIGQSGNRLREAGRLHDRLGGSLTLGYTVGDPLVPGGESFTAGYAFCVLKLAFNIREGAS